MTPGLWVEALVPNAGPASEDVIHGSEWFLREDASVLVGWSFSVYDQLDLQSSMKEINEENT